MKHIRQWNTLGEAKALIPPWIYRQLREHITDDTITPWCGQFCLMMITGATFDEACVATSQIGGTTKEDLMNGLRLLGYQYSWFSVANHGMSQQSGDHKRIRGQMAIAHLRLADSDWSHWLVYDKGHWLDPGQLEPGYLYGAAYWIDEYIVIDKCLAIDHV